MPETYILNNTQDLDILLRDYKQNDKFILKSMFKNKKKRDKIIKYLLETNHSHNMRFGPKHLRDFGLNINTNMPVKIQKIFDIFMKQYNKEF